MSELRSSLHPVTREELVAEIVDLRQRLEAAEKDAARYQFWCREVPEYVVSNWLARYDAAMQEK